MLLILLAPANVHRFFSGKEKSFCQSPSDTSGSTGSLTFLSSSFQSKIVGGTKKEERGGDEIGQKQQNFGASWCALVLSCVTAIVPKNIRTIIPKRPWGKQDK